MDIRKAIPSDSLLLSTLCMEVQFLHVQNHPEYFKPPESADFAQSFFDRLLQVETTFVYIAWENGEALGYVFCNLVDKPENPFTFARRYLMIEQISVRPTAQRKGVGRVLMAQAEVAARELGVPRIHLGSWDFNTSAHGFFERMGYRKRHFDFWKAIE